MAKRLELVVTAGPFAGKRFAVPPAGLRIGRASSNDVPIPDEELSRNHCLVEVSAEGELSVMDLASANGTFVNGVPLEAAPRPLKSGDLIEAGVSKIRVVVEGESPEPPKAPPKASPKAEGPLDLGLGAGKTEPDEPAPAAPAPADPKRKLVNILSLVAVVVLVAAIVVLLTDRRYTRTLFSKPPAPVVEEAPLPSPISLTYERVDATAERIVRYGAVVEGADIDLVYEVRALDAEEEKKVTKKGVLSKSTEDRLRSIFENPAWRAVESAVGATAEALNELKSWHLQLARDGEVKTVRVENVTPTGLFQEFCAALETGLNNDLQVSVTLRSAKDCKLASDRNEKEGDDLLAHKEVLPGNLWKALKSFQLARHDLEGVAGCYEDLARLQRKIESAERELSARYDDLNGRADQMLNLGQWTDAIQVYRAILDLIPDRADSRNIKAEEQIQKCDARLAEINRKGRR